MSEFEDREKETDHDTQDLLRGRGRLGELPAPILRERGEADEYNREADISRRGSAAYDVIQQDNIGAARSTSPGLTSTGTEVSSVFDVRPINGRDFVYTNTLTLSLIGDPN